jgi:hypothetical protein
MRSNIQSAFSTRSIREINVVQMTVHIQIAGQPTPFELDLTSKRWSAKNAVPEGYFPLVAELDHTRYELYSDKTFAESEL